MQDVGGRVGGRRGANTRCTWRREIEECSQGERGRDKENQGETTGGELGERGEEREKRREGLG